MPLLAVGGEILLEVFANPGWDLATFERAHGLRHID